MKILKQFSNPKPNPKVEKIIKSVDNLEITTNWTSLVSIPKYEFKFSDCPVCNQPVTSMDSTSGMYGMTSSVKPCGHPVSYNVTYGVTIIYTPYAYAGGGIVSGGGSGILGELMSICPGLASVWRPCPQGQCLEFGETPLVLSNLIQHVNDRHQWSREKIAEWLDIIAIEDPTVDLTIKPKEKKREQPSIGPSQEDYEKIIGYGSLSLSADAIKGLYEGILGSGKGVNG